MSEQNRIVMLAAPTNLNRVETGSVQFGDDWPGIFIRGDHAAHYSMALDALINGNSDTMTICVLRGLNELLKSSNLVQHQPRGIAPD